MLRLLRDYWFWILLPIVLTAVVVALVIAFVDSGEQPDFIYPL